MVTKQYDLAVDAAPPPPVDYNDICLRELNPDDTPVAPAPPAHPPTPTTAVNSDNGHNGSSVIINDVPESVSSSTGTGGDSGSIQLVVHRRMVSMQSPRTQCCCCAIGVFAAMFGIFMLSAGICIVLNVNYMEVDTSGLPPDLHNEDGKRIVGIILICVAICTLGLSATVSIIYFALCNRGNSRHSAVTSSSTSSSAAHHSNHSGHHHHHHHSNGNVHSSSSLSSSHHQYPNNKHISKVAAMHGVKAGGGGSGGMRGTPPGSQTSLNNTAGKQRRQVATSPSGSLVPAPSHSQSPSAGSKRGRRNMQKKAKAHGRLRNRSFALPTHTEEDSEAAKSVVDLKSYQASQSAENSSNSGSSVAPSQISSATADNQYYTTSFISSTPQGASSGIKASPVIIINEPTTQNDSSSTSPATSPATGESLPSNTRDDDSGEHGVAGSNTAVVYNENEIERTTEKVTVPLSSSSSSSPPHVSVINSSSRKDSYTYSNPAFQNDHSNMDIDPAVLQTTVSLDHDASECTTDEYTPPPTSDRLSPPLRQPQPSSSSSPHTASTSPRVASNSPTTLLQYPETDPTSGNTYPTPLISAGLDLGDDTEQEDLTGDQDSINSANHPILQVQPHHKQPSPSSEPTAIHNTSMQSDASSTLPDLSGEATSGDVVSDLPQSSRHHDRYNNTTSNNRGQYTVNISNNNIDNLESRSESRSSFNSSLSTDGEDRDDMARMQEKMKDLLK